MSHIYIIGNGGHARDIASYIMGIHDTTTPGPVTMLAHHSEYVRDEMDVMSWYNFVIGINDPHTRAQVAEELGYEGHSVVASKGTGRFPYDNRGVVIAPGCQFLIDCYAGKGTHINYGCMMTRTKIGEFTTLGPGVHIAGDVVIGDRVFIGIGATIGNLVTIGDDAIIGAGSVVLKDVAAGQKVLGVWA